MKKIHLVIIVGILLNPGLMAQSGKSSINLKPTNAEKKVEVKIGGKSKYYYSIGNETPSTINVKGPGKLRVITRGHFAPESGNRIHYKIQYSIDGGELKTVKIIGVEKSKEATYLQTSLGGPGELNSFEINLGRGSHSIDFKLIDSKSTVNARYIFNKSTIKKQEWIAYSPEAPSEPIDLVTKEEIVQYYRFSKEKPLVIKVNGPTELQLLSRIENHYTMKGRIKYRLQVTENGKVMNTYQLSNTRSEVTVYKNDAKLIPGKACEFVIKVPKGTHTYQIVPLDQDKGTVLGRLLLPKKNVKLKN